MPARDEDEHEEDVSFDVWDGFGTWIASQSAFQNSKACLPEMPDDVSVWVLDDYFPDSASAERVTASTTLFPGRDGVRPEPPHAAFPGCRQFGR